MEDELNNRVRMINTLTGFVDADSAPYSGISQFPIVNGQVKTKMTIVNGLNLIASGTTKGITIDVGVVRISMETIAHKVAKGTFAYATASNNNELKATVNWTDAKLSKLQKEEVDDVCQAIHDAAHDNVAAIAGYGVIAVDITSLQAAIDLYRPLTGKTRLAQVNINSAKNQMQEIVSGIIKFELKGQMDPMIETLESVNKTYHDDYFKVREILDLATTTAKARGDVHDVDTDAFINGVLFAIYKHGETTVYKSVLTSGKGVFNISDIDANDYDFEWSKAGFVTQREESVHIAAGKEIQRKIKLKAV